MRYKANTLLIIIALFAVNSQALAEVCKVMQNYEMKKYNNDLWVLTLHQFEVWRYNTVHHDWYGDQGDATPCDYTATSDYSYINKTGREHDLLIGFGMTKNPLKTVPLTFFPHSGFSVVSDAPDQYLIQLRGHLIRACWLQNENTWAHNSDPTKDGPCTVKENTIPSNW